MQTFNHFYTMVDQHLRVDKSIFVPDELPTTLEVLREVILHKSLELLIAIKVYRVPKLRFAVVQIIDAVEIQILLVPSKHSFPTADVYIGIRHSRYFLVS